MCVCVCWCVRVRVRVCNHWNIKADWRSRQCRWNHLPLFTPVFSTPFFTPQSILIFLEITFVTFSISPGSPLWLRGLFSRRPRVLRLHTVSDFYGMKIEFCRGSSLIGMLWHAIVLLLSPTETELLYTEHYPTLRPRIRIIMNITTWDRLKSLIIYLSPCYWVNGTTRLPISHTHTHLSHLQYMLNSAKLMQHYTDY